MNKTGYWIHKKTENRNGFEVHEVKCPFCKFCETYTNNPPTFCYICGAELKINYV